MSNLEHVVPLETRKTLHWQRFLLDSGLAFVGSMLITAIIYFLRLYPRIPNISIIYLLVVLALASTRGRYAAILASVVAFLSFDYFLVPPLYVFTIDRVEEWIALFVFLVTAILTSQLAVALRERAEQSSRRERETRILYDLLRLTNRQSEPERQLHAIAQAVVDAFSTWGVYDCAILQADAAGTLHVQANAYKPVGQIMLTSDEQAIATWVIAHGRTMGLYDEAALPLPVVPSSQFVQRIMVGSTKAGHVVHRSSRLVPLKMGQNVVGVLLLRILEQPHLFPYEERFEKEFGHHDEGVTFFWTFLDQVTALVERARLQRENLRIAILQRIDGMRVALLSSVSHDLRTPLTSIKAAASSLLQEDVQWDEEARLGFAQTIEHEADRLNRLVSNLLDMSRIEEGALKPEKEWHSLKALIHDVLSRLEPLHVDHPIRTHFPDDLLFVELDYVQMDQVITNLIENAVHYTPVESPIDVEAYIEGKQAVISVSDRGPGIPAADLERVFDKFYRVQDGHHLGGYTTGSGLGLAVCKGIVEAHGGHIMAKLREGGGLVVIVVLPVGEQERIDA
jgi:two-component system sensor histidine kinase KdpD